MEIIGTLPPESNKCVCESFLGRVFICDPDQCNLIRFGPAGRKVLDKLVGVVRRIPKQREPLKVIAIGPDPDDNGTE